MSKQETVSVSTFKKWPFHSDFLIETEDGKVKSATCKYCSEIDYQDLMREAKYRGLKGQILKSLNYYREKVSYIHRGTFSKHVGDSKSLHNWCKEKITGEKTVEEAGPSTQQQQQRVDDCILSSSKEYYTILFRTVLMMLEEELPFTKLESLVELQKKSGAKISSSDKLNSHTATEMATILCEVMTSDIKTICQEGKFASLTGDGSEARKTSEAKELVFLKLLAKGWNGYVPVTFLLKCQRLKDFGGASADGTFRAMVDALESYFPESDYLQKLVCLVADGASVNFGHVSGALTRVSELVEWDIPKIHCLNHRLELAMKDSYEADGTFEQIKDHLDTLFRLFKNSGKAWSLYQLLASRLNLIALRFTKVGGTRFQAHILRALTNFLRNFVVSLLFAENVEESGSGKNSVVTKDMYPKIVGFRKKWLKFEFIIVVGMYLKVLNQTSHLCYMFESDSVLIYQLREAIQDTIENLEEMLVEDDETEIMPQNIKILSETVESENFLDANTILIQAESTNVSAKKLRALNKLPEATRQEAEKNVVKIRENFKLNNVKQGREKLSNVKSTLIPTIIDNIKERFGSLLGNDDMYEAFTIFDVSMWADGEDSDQLIERDNKYIQILAERFNKPLDVYDFNLNIAKKEWRKVV